MAGTLSIVALGSVSRGLLDTVAVDLGRYFEMATVVDPPLAEPHYAFNPTRKQHNAAAVVRKLGQNHLKPGRDAVVAFGHFDFFEPETDYVLADADRDLRAAVVGLTRIRETRDDDRFLRRLQLVSIWAVGQALGKRSCDDPRCLMNRPERIEELDRRSGNLCAACKQAQIRGY